MIIQPVFIIPPAVVTGPRQFDLQKAATAAGSLVAILAKVNHNYVVVTSDTPFKYTWAINTDVGVTAAANFLDSSLHDVADGSVPISAMGHANNTSLYIEAESAVADITDELHVTGYGDVE